jgi:hypothetical protein
MPNECAVCGFEWTIDVEPARPLIGSAPRAYAAILERRDGMVPAVDGGWNATAYL